LRAANVVVFLLGAATFAMWFFLSLYLQQVRGYSPLHAGLAFLPMTLSIVVASTLASRGVTRVGPKPLLVAGMALLGLGLALFTQLSPDGSYLGTVLGPSILAAVGMGMAFVPVTIAAVSGVALHEAGLASGLVNTSRLFGGALGLAILAAIATAHTNTELHHAVGMHVALTSGFVLSFAIAAAFAAAGAVVALVGLPGVSIREARRRAVVTESA
jgi:MFS family permease